SPNVMGRALSLHPLTVITVILAAGSIAGFIGILFAVPFYAVVKTIIVHFYETYRNSKDEDEYLDRKSTRLNSSHVSISYAVFCLSAQPHPPSFPTRRSSDLSPNVMGRALSLHPLTVITVILAAGSIAGFIGILFAVPFYAVVKTIIVHFYETYRNSKDEDEY